MLHSNIVAIVTKKVCISRKTFYWQVIIHNNGCMQMYLCCICQDGVMYSETSSRPAHSLSRYSRITLPPLYRGVSGWARIESRLSSIWKALPVWGWHNRNFCARNKKTITVLQKNLPWENCKWISTIKSAEICWMSDRPQCTSEHPLP